MERVNTTILASSSVRGSSRWRRCVNRFRTKASQNAQRTVTDAYSTAYPPFGSLNRLGAGAVLNGVGRWSR